VKDKKGDRQSDKLELENGEEMEGMSSYCLILHSIFLFVFCLSSLDSNHLDLTAPPSINAAYRSGGHLFSKSIMRLLRRVYIFHSILSERKRKLRLRKVAARS
jgi:hypothetical protein